MGARLRIAAVAACLAAIPAAAHADGTVYVTTSRGISQYAMGADGSLSPLRPATVGASSLYGRIAIAPNGKSAYLGTDGSRVLQFDVDPRTGALSPKTPPYAAAIPTTPYPNESGTGATIDVTAAPDGRHAYVTATELQHGGPGGNLDVLLYDIDPSTGALSLTKGAGSFGFLAFAMTLDGRSAYVGTFPDRVFQYDADPQSGALSPKTPASVVAGRYPLHIVVTPDGRGVYVVKLDNQTPNNTIAQYNVDPLDGSLSPKTPPTVLTGPTVSSIAVSPDGRSAYVGSLGPPLHLLGGPLQAPGPLRRF